VFTDDADLLAAYVPELKTQLKGVVEALMHPSLDSACGAYHAGGVLGDTTFTPLGRRAPLPRGAARPATVLLQRGAACLSLLAEVAIDRAVALGNETVMVEAA